MRLNKVFFDAILLEILQQHHFFYSLASFNSADLFYLSSSDFCFLAYFNSADFFYFIFQLQFTTINVY